MVSDPSERQLEMQRRVAREESRDRRTVVWVQWSASGVLIASTLLAWMSHPRVEHHLGRTPSTYVRDVSYTIGVLTRPAGLLTLVVGVVALVMARKLRTPSRKFGWLAFGLAWMALGISTGEVVQLILGRRNWLSDLSATTVPSATANAIGVGVWIATAASVALLASASAYLWLEYRQWRVAPART